MARKNKIVGKDYNVDWCSILFNRNDPKLHRMYYAFKSKHDISDNRCALAVLKKFYSTTALGLCVMFNLKTVDEVLGMSLEKFKKLSEDLYL